MSTYKSSYPATKRKCIILANFGFKSWIDRQVHKMHKNARQTDHGTNAAHGGLKHKIDQPKYEVALKRKIDERVKMMSLDENRKSVESIYCTFEALKFDVTRLVDGTIEETREFVRNELKKVNEKQYDCLLVYISSHGLHEYMLCDDGYLSLFELYKMANKCVALVGQPKVFIIDTCQEFKEDKHPPIIMFSDFLFAFASYKGFPSYSIFGPKLEESNLSLGSIYSNELVNALNKYRDSNICSVLTAVRAAVGEKFRSDFNHPNHYQLPYYESTFGKELYLGKLVDSDLHSTVGQLKMENDNEIETREAVEVLKRKMELDSEVEQAKEKPGLGFDEEQWLQDSPKYSGFHPYLETSDNLADCPQIASDSPKQDPLPEDAEDTDIIINVLDFSQ